MNVAIHFLFIECLFISFFFCDEFDNIKYVFFSPLFLLHLLYTTARRTHKKEEMKNYFTNTKNLTEAARERERVRVRVKERERVRGRDGGRRKLLPRFLIDLNLSQFIIQRLAKKNILPNIARNKTSLHGCCCC